MKTIENFTTRIIRSNRKRPFRLNPYESIQCDLFTERTRRTGEEGLLRDSHNTDHWISLYTDNIGTKHPAKHSAKRTDHFY